MKFRYIIETLIFIAVTTALLFSFDRALDIEFPPEPQIQPRAYITPCDPVVLL